MRRAMTTRERQRDILETRALRKKLEDAERDGRSEELRIELGLKQPPQVDPVVAEAQALLSYGKAEPFFAYSENLDAGQRYQLVSRLSDQEHAVYVRALELADRTVSS